MVIIEERQRREGGFQLILETLVNRDNIQRAAAAAITNAISSVVTNWRDLELIQRDAAFVRTNTLPEFSGEKKESTLEQEVVDSEVNSDHVVKGQDKISSRDRIISVNIHYSFEQERLCSVQVESSPVNYQQLFYGENPSQKASFNQEDEYWSPSLVADTESELLSAEEAEKKFTEIQYAAVMGNRFSVHFNETRKLDLWIKFNPALFSALESLYAVTRDVDYSSF